MIYGTAHLQSRQCHRLSNFSLIMFHLTRDWSLCTISFLQRVQNKSIKYWALRHWRKAYKSSRLDDWTGCVKTLDFMVSKWLGVSGFRDNGSSKFWTASGRLLITAAVSAKTVNKLSSFNWLPCSIRMPSITRLATPITRSQTPPLWLAANDWSC